MVAPKIILFYTSTWKCVVKRERPTEQDIITFIQGLPRLRDVLSCAVCRNLLSGESLFSVELCDHYVCQGCKGLPRDEQQLCGNCRDWKDFSEDETLLALLAGHSRHCRIFLRSSDCTSLLEEKQGSDPEIDVFRILDILQEGAKIVGGKKIVVSKFKKEDTLNPPLQVSHLATATSTPSQSPIKICGQEVSTSTNSEDITSTATAVKNCASTSSSIISNSISSGSISKSNSNFVRTKEDKKLVQVILEKENEDSIDIKIEPVYQNQNHHLDGDEDMDDSDSSDNSRKSEDENCIEQDEEEMSSEEIEDDNEMVEDEGMTVELNINSEDVEEYSGQVTIQPQPSPNPTTTSISFPMSSVLSSSSVVQPQPQVIYARTTSLPQTGVKQLPPNLVSATATPTPQVMQLSPPRQFHSYVLTRPVATMSTNTNPPQQIQMHNYQPTYSAARGGVDVRVQTLPTGQTIRLARVALPSGSRALAMVRQVLNHSQSGPRGGIRHISVPVHTSDLTRKKIVVRPASGPGVGVGGVRLATPATATLQRWPDANAVLQYASGSGAVVRGPTTFTVSQSRLSTMLNRPPNTPSTPSSSTSTSNIIFTTNTQTKPNSLTNTYSSSSISSSSSSGSSGTMNHISASSSSGSGSSSPSPGTTATFTDSAGNIIGTTISLPEALRKTATVKVKPPSKVKPSKIRSGCRCGNAASQPSKLTCCGQRCTCYVDGKSCVDCKCRGCNNPYIPGGKKLMQGLNAVIDTKTNATVPIISQTGGGISVGAGNVTSSTMNFVPASSSNSSSSMMTNNNSINNVVVSSSSSSPTMNLVPMIPHSSTTTSMAPHIFTRIQHHPGTSHQPSTTYSQIIPVANFSGQFGQFTIPLPISLISPQSHSDIHLQLNPNLNLQHHNHHNQ